MTHNTTDTMKPLIVPGALESLSSIGKYVLDSAEQANLDRKEAYRLRLAIDEIATNIIVHGYEEAGINGNVVLTTKVDDHTLTIIVEDTAQPFDPRRIKPPDNLDAPLENRSIGGLGVYLAINGVDEFSYEYIDNHNRNIFVMNRTVPV